MRSTSAAILASEGSAPTQGPHQVAQKSTSTGLGRADRRSQSPPPTLGSASAGAGSPAFSAATGLPDCPQLKIVRLNGSIFFGAVNHLQEALQQGRFDDRMEALAFEAVASMPVPLADGDVELLARLLLQAPLFDADAELRRAEMFADGRAGWDLGSAALGFEVRNLFDTRAGDPVSDILLADRVARDPRAMYATVSFRHGVTP